MPQVNFRTSDFRRKVADSQSLILKNRYFEKSPFLTEAGEAGPSLVARPGLRYLTTVGDGPIRGLFSASGAFGGDVFVGSGSKMFRMTSTLVATEILDGLVNPNQGFINGAITSEIGDVPELFFFCDGVALYVYTADGFAHNTLTGTPADNDVVLIGTMYYKWTSGSVNAGTPAGTVGSPWLVNLDITPTLAFANMWAAVGNLGISGTAYSTALTANTLVNPSSKTASSFSVRAKVPGVFGNTIPTTETGGGIAWSLGATLSGGGSGSVSQIPVPDDLGVIDVAVSNSFVIVIPAQVEGFQGRFYWIEPGETTIDPLNFATAERAPDGINGVEVFGDQFYLPGDETTEVWYFTGDATFPVRRLQGVVFDRGAWSNTALAINETLYIVDADGGVFLIQGGSPQRVSTPDIEEEIREAISAASGYPF